MIKITDILWVYPGDISAMEIVESSYCAIYINNQKFVLDYDRMTISIADLKEAIDKARKPNVVYRTADTFNPSGRDRGSVR